MTQYRNDSPALSSTQLLDQIASAQLRLRGKLLALQLPTSSISQYSQRYLGSKVASAESTLQLYGGLLFLALKDRPIPLEESLLVDYGGGTGLISFLAAEIGIGTVVYNDIYETSCRDVEHLSRLFGLPLNHIVCGDVDELVSYIHQESLRIDAIVSYDVLEHIYDVERHFKMLRTISNRGFRIAYGSGANAENPMYVRSVKRKQLDVEYRDGKREFGTKDRDSLRAYLDIRRSIIASHAPDLNPGQVEYLARSTRGLIQRDIQTCVDDFRRDGSMPYHIDHPTNTCDPTTGNWCEHLMDIRWLERILQTEGFRAVEIVAGRYTTCGSLPKRTAKRILNTLCQLLGRKGMVIAPYYVVYAESPGQCYALDGG